MVFSVPRSIVKILRRFYPPISLQTEENDCGLACLSMISSFYGNSKSLNKLKQNYPNYRDGLSILELKSIAEDFSFQVKVSHCTQKTFRKRIRLPAILLAKNHYQVIYKQESYHLIVADPAYGLRKIKTESVTSNSETFLIRLKPNSNFKANTVGPEWSSLKSCLFSEKKKLTLLFVSSFFLSAIQLMMPLLLLSYGRSAPLPSVYANLPSLILALLGTEALYQVFRIASNQMQSRVVESVFEKYYKKNNLAPQSPGPTIEGIKLDHSASSTVIAFWTDMIQRVTFLTLGGLFLTYLLGYEFAYWTASIATVLVILCSPWSIQFQSLQHSEIKSMGSQFQKLQVKVVPLVSPRLTRRDRLQSRFLDASKRREVFFSLKLFAFRTIELSFLAVYFDRAVRGGQWIESFLVISMFRGWIGQIYELEEAIKKVFAWRKSWYQSISKMPVERSKDIRQIA